MYNIYKKIVFVTVIFLLDSSLYSMLSQFRLSRIRIPKRGVMQPQSRLYTSPTQLGSPEIKPAHQTKGFFAYGKERIKNWFTKNNYEITLRKKERELKEEKLREANRIIEIDKEDLEDSLKRLTNKRDFREKFLPKKE